jgi:hypothetical protein
MREIDLDKLPHNALLQLIQYYEQQAEYFREAAEKIIEKPKIEKYREQRREKELIEINDKHLRIYKAIEGYRASGMSAKESFLKAKADFPSLTLEQIMFIHGRLAMKKRQKRMAAIEYLTDEGFDQKTIGRLLGIHQKSISRLFAKGRCPSRPQG